MPPVIPPEIIAAFEKMLWFAQRGDLGIISTLDKATGQPRWVIAARHHANDDDTIGIEPLGYLSDTVFDEVDPPDAAQPKIEVTLPDDADQGPPPLDDYNAVGIAEGWIEADEDRQIAAWQRLEDTGLGYRLQGWFGRRLTQLKAEGRIVPANRNAGDADAA